MVSCEACLSAEPAGIAVLLISIRQVVPSSVAEPRRCTCASANLRCLHLVAVVLQIDEVFGWAREIAVPLSWLAIPIGLWCAIDSWILAPPPDRRLAPCKGSAGARHRVRGVTRAGGGVGRAVDFRGEARFQRRARTVSLVTGLVWRIDHLVFSKQREEGDEPAAKAGGDRAPRAWHC